MDVKKLTKKTNRELGRYDRRLQSKQQRSLKRQEAIALKRSIGSENKPPILVVVYARSGAHALTVPLKLIRSCDPDAVISETRSGVHVAIPKFKLRYCFLTVPDGDRHAFMDAVKVADVLLLVHSLAADSEDINGDPLLTAVYSHFLPTTVHVVNGLESLHPKKRSDARNRVQKAIHERFPDEKLHIVDREQEALQLLHLIGNCKKKRMTYKCRRSQVIAESITFDFAEGNATGKMIVSGYVRSKALNVNGLVHVPGFGDLQLERLEVLPDPRPLNQRKEKSQEQKMITTRVIKPDVLLQETTERENELDPMEGEQTFPTSEEIAEAAAAVANKTVKKVPAGTSDYQAAWIVDDDADGEETGGGDESSDSEESEGDDDDMDVPEAEDVEDEEEGSLSSGEETEMASVTVAENEDEKYDANMDEGEEEEMRQKYRDAREDELFPDEVDTPLETAARVRFARYRGLRSFHFSSWDPKENLPTDYSRIFQFQNFNRSKRRVLTADEETDDAFLAEVGTFVKATLVNVSQDLRHHFASHEHQPLILYGLLKYEQKMSVLNVLLRKHPSCDLPIKSKDKLIFHVGCRRFVTRAVFSAHTNGNKFKYERFLRPDTATVATMYAPITFPPASVVVFKEESDGTQVLIATGSTLSVNPDRLVIKRLILSGHPFKINKKLAVVRYMFYNRDDIAWFKPIELRTKYGRKGHIKAALGTHGHMKCYFDRQLDSMDTVLMNLYKRVFPKWTYDERVPEPSASPMGD